MTRLYGSWPRRWNILPRTTWLSRFNDFTACGSYVAASPTSGLPLYQFRGLHQFFSTRRRRTSRDLVSAIPGVIVLSAFLAYSLYPADLTQSPAPEIGKEKAKTKEIDDKKPEDGKETTTGEDAWFNFSSHFESASLPTDVEWSKLFDNVADFILPPWSRLIPGYVRKLQRELSMAPGSLADEIWREAQDPTINPEIRYSAKVRVSDELCTEEEVFLKRRKQIISVALAKYLGIDERDVHPDDIPVIAICGSGGGLRALVAGAGSFLAAAEDGLFDCVTYTAGVSGSCWLQAVYNSSVARGDFGRVIDHLKARINVHIAYPPAAFSSIISAPTNKYLLSGMVEKLRGDPSADFGLVDVYGILLAARLLVPKGELGVNEKDFKLSNQHEYINYGQNPLPIYTAVRHEIPVTEPSNSQKVVSASTETASEARDKHWFQWFEITPYEFFCEEFSAGIPTWAIGRKFKNGSDVPAEKGFYLPELRMPLLLGIFGSAFCASLSHYYREIRPLVQRLGGFQAVDELIYGRDEDLSKVHPIDPALLPNFAYGMEGKLPPTTPRNIIASEYMQLMDAGMSNNLPIYPLLRPRREVDIIIAFDASADVKTDNWLSVADGYARQRGIKGWPVGMGWAAPTEKNSATAQELDRAQTSSPAEAEARLTEAKTEQAARRIAASSSDASSDPDNEQAPRKKPPSGPDDSADKFQPGDETAGELGYCTVWVGTTQERSTDGSSPDDTNTPWQQRLAAPEAGLAVAYLPLLRNEAAAPGVDPAGGDGSEYLSTWNFAYTPAQVDSVVTLARANYAAGALRLREAVRTVYERKRRRREAREQERERWEALLLAW